MNCGAFLKKKGNCTYKIKKNGLCGYHKNWLNRKTICKNCKTPINRKLYHDPDNTYCDSCMVIDNNNNNNNNNSVMCTICLSNEGNMINLECKHVFHKDCILKWKDECPVCRAPIKIIKDNLTKDDIKILKDNKTKMEEEINRENNRFSIRLIDDILPEIISLSYALYSITENRQNIIERISRIYRNDNGDIVTISSFHNNDNNNT